MKKRYLILDGSSVLFKAYYALPEMTTSDGKYTNAILGFMNILMRAIEDYEPSHLAVCFDLKGPTFRNEMYSEYKGTRQKTPEDLLEQFDYIKEILGAFDYKVLELKGYEADDIAGTLAKLASKNNDEVFVLTGDKDYIQLADENITILYSRRGITDIVSYTVEEVKEEYGIRPDQIVDMMGLMGDPSDNIPGIDGIGQVRALKLLEQFETLENLYENTDKLNKNKTNQKVIDSEDIARLSKELATININTPIEINETELEIKEPDDKKVSEALSKFELNALMKRLGFSGVKEEKIEIKNYDIEKNIDINKVIDLIKEKKELSFKFIGTDKAYNGGIVTKIGFLVEDNIFIVDIEDGDLIKLKEVFEDEGIIKKGYDLKEEIIYLLHNEIKLKNYYTDVSLAEYLIDATNSDYTFTRLASKYGVKIPTSLDFLKKNKKLGISQWEDEEQDEYLISILTLIDNISEIQMNKLEEMKMMKLFQDIEMPLIEVLADMEYTGVAINKNELYEIGKELDLEIEKITNTIYSLVGEEFNINSPKQLGEILFEKLKLPVIKKTKTGYSTNIDVLEALEDKHEVISYIIRYRTIAKLKSTYVDGLLAVINPETGRIHSHFNQTIAATGRLSSTNPNLQNIPVKTEEGRLLRKIFVASDDNKKLVDADYSQIELRILASISNDENMIDAFKNKLDIHRSTAAKVFGIELEEVTPSMRNSAKAVNFGIVYGISDYGLSQDLKISRNEAKEYIDNYLEQFSGVRNYMKYIVEDAKSKGYVETLYGRKRYLPELESRNWNIRSFGERIALNMPIQGTAADIIKIAMINVYNRLNKESVDAKLILQIHDELIIECKKEDVDFIEEMLVEEMRLAGELEVPLVVDVNVGDSWYDTK